MSENDKNDENKENQEKIEVSLFVQTKKKEEK